MRCRSPLLLCLILVTWTAAGGCSRSRRYPIEGQILAIDATRKEITLRHGDIKGFMPGMTMPFAVEDGRVLTERKPGDLIRATLVVSESSGRLEQVEKIGEAPLPADATGEPRSPMLQPGDSAPDAALVDQEGRPRHLSEWRGKTVAVTFVYTRCPLPNFCPLMDRHFAAVQRAISSDARLSGRVALLSVSFDPEFDTPEVLRAHARGAGADPQVWTWLTGERKAVEAFALSFGVSALREGTQTTEIVHNLRTAVIDRDGKIAGFLTGNEWTPDMLLAEIRAADAR